MTRRTGRKFPWCCSVEHRRQTAADYARNAEARIYADTRYRLRTRIERKRQLIAELEQS